MHLIIPSSTDSNSLFDKLGYLEIISRIPVGQKNLELENSGRL